VKRDTRNALSAMVATLLACGGAALIAGAPDWVSRMAVSTLAGSPDGAVSQNLRSLRQRLDAFRDAFSGALGSPTVGGGGAYDLVTVDSRPVESRPERAP
jgi:hypothetical protein